MDTYVSKFIQQHIELERHNVCLRAHTPILEELNISMEPNNVNISIPFTFFLPTENRKRGNAKILDIGFFDVSELRIQSKINFTNLRFRLEGDAVDKLRGEFHSDVLSAVFSFGTCAIKRSSEITVPMWQ